MMDAQELEKEPVDPYKVIFMVVWGFGVLMLVWALTPWFPWP